MRILLVLLLVAVLVGGGLKLAGMQIPILDYPLAGSFRRRLSTLCSRIWI